MASRRKAAPTNAVEAGTTPPPAAIRSKFVGVPLGWQPAAEALPTISAVRTIFPDFNLRSRIGGLPSERVVVVHGATHGGKTACVIGLIASYLLGGHAVAYVDAEHSTPREYMAQLVEQVTGTPIDQLGGFFAKRPKNYEDTITDVDRFLHFMKEQRRANPELRALIVVDSLNELTPKRELEQMLSGINKESSGEEGAKAKRGPRAGKDKGGDNIDKGWGRVRAQLNAAWLSHLIPRLAEAGCTLVAIAQEKEGEDREVWEQDLMDEYEILGGKKSKYAASMLLRVVKVRPVREGEGRDAETLSWEHRIRIWKSKVGPMEGRWTDCTFYLRLDGSFDVARNLIHTGKELGVITKSDGSAWMSFGGVRVNGERALVARLEKDSALLDKLAAAVNAAVDAKLERAA